MNKKRIAIFAENLYGGGVEKILQIICCNFDYEHYDVTLYSSRYEDMPQGTYPSNLQHKYYFDSFHKSKNSLCKFLAKVINKFKLTVYYHLSPEMFYRLFIRKHYDVGIAFIEGYATRIVSGGPEGMKKIAWIHTDMTDNHWTTVAFQSSEEEKQAYHRFDKVVCVSRKAEEVARSIFAINKTMVLHNPLDVYSIIKKSSITKVDKNICTRIVSLGWLIKVKGYDRLLRVMRKLVSESHNVELYILGEGQLRTEFEQYIEENGLKDKVFLTGFIDNPYPYLKSADIYVCSSYAEGFNTAISEAIVLGRAIVATDISGVREQLGENSEYGIITENSEQGLYDGICKMLQAGNIEYYQNKSKERREIFNLQVQMLSIYNLIES